MQDSTPIRLSIIIPVYNTERFLKDCLDSLLHQGIEDCEILCVNDGSTDSSPRILEEYAARDARFRVLHQENAGLSAARNRGVEMARGRYLYFCDSDDMICGTMLRTLLELAEARGALLAAYDYRRVSEETVYTPGEEAPNEGRILQGVESVLSRHYVWSYVIAREAVETHGIRFLEGFKYSEDELFMARIKALVPSQRVCYLKAVGYLYRQNSHSIMHEFSGNFHRNRYRTCRVVCRFYGDLLRDEPLSEPVRREAEYRYRLMARNALYDGVFITEKPVSEIIRELKADGIYPCKLPWRTLKWEKKSLSVLAMNYALFLLPFRPYYTVFTALLRLRLKRGISPDR